MATHSSMKRRMIKILCLLLCLMLVPVPGTGAAASDSGITGSAEPIEFYQWYYPNEGVIKSGYYWLCAGFTATNEITSIEYEISTDNENWIDIPSDMILDDYSLFYDSEDQVWGRELELDFSDYFTYDAVHIRATATDEDGEVKSETTALTIDLYQVKNLTAAPNGENNVIVLSWENPAVNFNYAEIERWEDYGDWSGWSHMRDTTENTYTDTDVAPYQTYRYRVTAVDDDCNEGVPLEVTGQLVATAPVMFGRWDLPNDGKVGADYVNDYGINAHFYASHEITSIIYEISTDNENWMPIPSERINNEYELYYQNWSNTWERYISIDLSDFGQDNLYLRARATDENSATVTATVHLTIDLVCEVATNYSAAPNEDNTAIVLNWSTPADFDYAEIYKEYYYYGWKWGWEADVTGTTYTDTDIDIDNPYATYRYKIILYDKHGNESPETPIFSGSLAIPGPIAAKEFNTQTENGRINRQNASNYYLSAYFLSAKPITQIQYDYSLDGSTWQDLRPFISEDQKLNRVEKDFYSYRFIRMNIGPDSGIPDGPISIRASAVDEDANTLSQQVDLIKDAAPPGPVTNITAVPNEDNTGIVLSWTNPADEDFQYLRIDGGTIRTPGDFNQETFTDTGAKPGIEYTYKFTSYDEFGNSSMIQPEIKATLLTSVPDLEEIVLYPPPVEGNWTNAASLGYSTLFRSSLPVERIHYEISNDNGASWTTLRDVVPEKRSDGYYYSGSWDISQIGEETWLLRATAYDTAGASSSGARTIHVDHVAPPPPANFTAEIASTSPNKISFSWDSVENAKSYSLTKIHANPADSTYNPSYNILAPATTTELTYDIRSQTPYIFTIETIDLAGNRGNPVSLTNIVEIYTGPTITLDNGYLVYTKESNYTLSGKAASGASVSINNNTVTTDAEGKFSYSTTLSTANNGINDFTIQAEKDEVTHTVKQRAVLDTSPPTISNFYVYGGNLIKGNKVQIYMSASDSYGSIGEKTVQITTDEVNWYDVIEFSPDKSEAFWDTTAPVKDLGVLADGPYKFRASVWDKAGNHTVGSAVIWTIDNTRPEPPTGLTITSEIGKNKLNWSASASGDVGTSYPYTVYRSTKSGSDYQQLNTTNNTYYDDATAQYDVIYYYVVTVTDKAGNISIYSNEASSKVAVDKTPPVFKSLPPENWTYGNNAYGNYFEQRLVATDDSAQGVKEFKVEYSNDSGGTWKAFTSGASSRSVGEIKEYYTTIRIYTAGMSHGAHLFRYSATDYADNTVTSLEINTNIDLTAYPVQNLRARAGEAAVILQWDPPIVTESGVYEIHRSTYYSGDYNRIKDYLASTEQSYTDTSVTIGNLYYYKVITRDNYYNKAASNITSAVPTDDLTPPVITYVEKADETLLGGKQIGLFLKATDNKAPTSIGFTGSQDGGDTWTPLNASLSGKYQEPNSNTYQFSYNWNSAGLASGEIKVRMVAKDAAGNTSEVVERTWNLDLEVSPPSNLRTTGGDGNILIQWDPVTDTDLYSYSVWRATVSGGPYSEKVPYIGKNTLSYTDENVETGETYYYVIEARDTFGNTARSAEIAASPAGDEVPPHIDSISPASGTTIGGDKEQEIKFYASDNAGRLGTTAVFEYSADGGNTWMPVSDTYSGPLAHTGILFYFTDYWNLRDLVSGEYKVRYTVRDAAGNTTQLLADYTVDRTPPSAPKNLLANYGLMNIGLGWEIPAEADVKGYRVYRSNSRDSGYEKIEDIAGKDNNSFADDTVLQGITYYYQVTSIDTFNQEGLPSNTASAAAIADHVPPVVISVEPDYYTVIGANAKITVTAEDNSALSSITLEYLNEDTANWVPINTIATLDTAVFNWSTIGFSREMRIRAIAKDSAGNLSNPDDGKAIKVYIIDNEGPDVTGLRGSSFGGDIVLEWNNVTDKDFDYFLVEKKDSSGIYRQIKKIYNVLGYNVTGLDPATDYEFRVTAFDKAGNAGSPAEVTVNSGNDTYPPQVFYKSGWHGVYAGNESILIDAFEAVDSVGVKKIIAEYEADDGTWIEISSRTLDTTARSVRTAELWDVSGLPDGIYYVRVLAEDAVGNRSEPSEETYYIVDHINPEAPDNLELTSTAGYIDISWEYKAQTDFSHFRLFRSQVQDGPYEEMNIGKYHMLRYLDRDVESGNTYYYKVMTVDIAGNESGYSQIISGQLTPDTNPPFLWLYAPTDVDVLTLQSRFYVIVSDDLALKNLLIEIRASGDEGEWIRVLSKDYDPEGSEPVTSANENFYWDSGALAEGRYDIRYYVTDKAGNVTGPLIMKHMLNNLPPEAPVLAGEPGGWSSSLSWTSDEPEDFDKYIVYRSTVLGSAFRGVGWPAEKSFVDTGVQPGIRYYYYVRAYDIYGNYSQSDTINIIPTNEDLVDPVANAGDDLILTVGLEAYFDGTLSKDNDRIHTYSWNFGDGTLSSAAQPVHSYSVAGEYTATLTVRDPAGNSHTDTASVKVVSPEDVGILEVRVVNDVTGELIPGASVVIDYPDGATLKVNTNSVGAAFLVAPPGDYKVYAYKTDFNPNAAQVTMTKGQRDTLMIRLPAGSVITGELKAQRMTLDEIIAAGIDINDPDNRQAYQFEIGLGFINQPIIATKNRFLPPAMKPNNFHISDDGKRIFIIEPGKEDGSGGRVLIGEKLDLGGAGDSAIAFMIIPGRTTWLKEFFDIGLMIQNGAAPEFIIEDAYANLTLPDGLSLAPTREGQHLYIDMGSIAGGESASVNWIVRGDKRGEYRLEAEFNGTIMPFGDRVKQKFRNEEPFRVWANNALKMHVQAQDRADKGYPYNLKIGVENVSDTPLYFVDFELLEETKANYIYAPNQKLKKVFDEMASGEVQWLDYQLIPAIEGDLELRNSFVLRTGGEADIETDIVSFSAPENAVGTAPVLTQVNKGDGTVDLSWDAVEGATGYKIYRVRQDLNISMEPVDLAYICGPEVLSVNLDEKAGPRDYVIKTITASGEIMRHAMTGFSWIDYLSEATLTIYPEKIIVNRTTDLLLTARRGGRLLSWGRVDLPELGVSGNFIDKFGPIPQITLPVTPERAGATKVQLYDEGEFLLEKTIQVVLPDPPSQPKGLNGTAGDRKAALTWFPNSEIELAGYYLYQIRNNGWSKINTNIIANIIDNNGKVAYEVTGLNDNTTYTFQVSAVDIYGRESIMSDPFQIGIGIPVDTIDPWVVGSSPANQQEGVPLNTQVRVFFNEHIALWDDDGTKAITFLVNGNPVEFEEEAPIDARQIILTLIEPLPLKSHCEVFIPAGAVRDRDFNVLDSEYRLTFFTGAEEDTIAPVLAGITPRENELSVSIHTDVRLYFSEDIAAGTAFDGLTVTANGSPVPFATAIAGNKITLTPLANFPYDAAIKVTVPAGTVVDGAGNALTDAHLLSFYTAGIPDTGAPRIVSMMPSANSTDVPLNAEINIYFSEKIQAGGNYGAIAIKNGDQVLAAEMIINGNALKILPAAILPVNKALRIELPAGAVADLSANPLAANYSAVFTTGEIEDHQNPGMLSSAPEPGQKEVALDSSVQMLFDEDIQPGDSFEDILLMTGSGPVSFEAQINGHSLVLTPMSDLPANSDLQLVVPSGALKDVAGNKLTSQQKLDFVTASGEGDQGPIDECFIATAAYGSKFEPSVALLRSFRDDYLLTTGLGKTLVEFYYNHSPAIARFIADNDLLRAGTRLLLSPAVILVYLLYHPFLLLLILPAIYVGIRYRRNRKWTIN